MPTSRRVVRPAWLRPALRGLALALAAAVVLSAAFAEEGDDPAPPAPPAPSAPPAPPAPPRPPARVLPPKQDLGTRLVPGGARIGRETMWPAPTAEDWAKPCLMTWQRTWDDAVAVAKETGKPILVCINMDGEIASEHYAGVRYRQPEIAKIYEPYVKVIASVYRHNPRDYDDEGNRIPCPRFGGVTCGEHIWIEPVIYEKFCDGKRIAPRHIAVNLQDEEAYDVYYTDDTALVFDAIQEGLGTFPPAKPDIVRGDRPVVDRVASRAVQDRREVEKTYRKGDGATRGALLDAAIANPEAAPLDLLRMAIFGLDVEMSRKARRALAQTGSAGATKLISESLRVPMDAAERDALIAALKRLGEDSRLARWLGVVHEGLAGTSSDVDVKGWPKGADLEALAAEARKQYESGLTWRVEERALAAEADPEDPVKRIQLAEDTLALAMEAPRAHAFNERMARLFARQLFADARTAAQEAQDLGAQAWRVHTVLALAAYYGGEPEDAYEHAAAAVKDLPAGDSTWSSMAILTIFAESRWKKIKTAVKAKEDWPAQWLADVHAAYTVLLRHPLGTDDQVVWHYETLVWLGAEDRAERVLREGLERFRDSRTLHRRFRNRLLRFRGPKGLEAAYARMLEEHDDPARLATYAGYASVVAAEARRRRMRFEPAIASYDRAVAWYEQAVEAHEANREYADHTIALARAGQARVAYQLGDDDRALEAILASFARRPGSAGTRDGMGITPGETAQMLLARLRRTDRPDDVQTLEEALAKIDPALLSPDIGLLGGEGGR